jgi:4-hydroxymandelate oxidase
MSAPLDRLESDRVEELARLVLETPTYEYIRAGAGEELALKANLDAFRRWRLQPRVLANVGGLDLATNVLGTALAFPVMIAPMAVHRMAHPDGEVATAHGAAAAGSLLTVSANASVPVEQVAARSPATPLWLQVYNWKDRTALAKLIARGEEAGCRAIMPTVNTPIAVAHGRRTTGFRLPTEVTFGHFETPPELDAGLDWSFVEWIADRTSLPVVPKGILRGDDARLAADAGAKGVVVSNHGGRQLDRVVATLDALPGIVAAAGPRLEIYIDGGVRRGADILTALALGARAVFIGRPVLYGLAVDGAEGVSRMLASLRKELYEDAALCGVPSLSQIPPDLAVRAPV